MEVSNGELGACGQPCGRIRCYSLQKTTFQAGKAKRAYSKLVKVTPTILPLVLIADMSVGVSCMYVCRCFNCGRFLW